LSRRGKKIGRDPCFFAVLSLKGVCGPSSKPNSHDTIPVLYIEYIYPTQKKTDEAGYFRRRPANRNLYYEKNQQNPYINYPQVVIIVFHRLVEARECPLPLQINLDG
jgi:hypothetical protein